MADMGIRSIVVKKFKYHSDKPVSEEKNNIINRDFEATDINQKWCTDITYIHTLRDGWTYLASVMDLFSRKIIGYAYGTSMTAELAVKAVENACLNVKTTEGIILHSDLGSQYTSQEFEYFLCSKGIIQSFSRKGNPYDNACIESFHSILKKEEVNHHKYYDFNVARKAIFEYIESWYNRKRIHGSIDYMTPQTVHVAASVAA
jgi:transposase InsO family protein